MKNDKELIGKKIKDIQVDGFGIEIVLDDNTVFMYYASDGGYSSWDYCTKEELEQNLEEFENEV